MTFDDVDKLALSFPGVTVASRWGNRTYVAGERGFAWQRPFSKADLKRFGDETPPAGEILAVRVADLAAKDAVLAIEPAGFFTIPHFNGHPAILIELRRARARDVRAAIADAFAAVTEKPARKASLRKPTAPRKPTARRSR